LKTVLSIQYLRAVAALSVVLFHTFQCTNNGFAVGAAGVDVFFVISGFVLWTVIEARPIGPGVFLWRRAVRVVPLYWTITVVLAAIALLTPGWLPQVKFTWPAFAESLTFIPHNDPVGDPFPLLPVGWTLNYEVILYLVMAAALLTPRAWRLWVITALLAGVTAIGFVDPPAYPLFANPMLMQFAAGAWLGQAWLKGALPGRVIGWALVIVGVDLFAAQQVLRLHAPQMQIMLDLWRPFLWGIPAFLTVAGAVSIEAGGGVPEVRALRVLGDASYSLYLCHWPVIAVITRFVPTTNFWLFTPIAIAAALIAGLACRQWVEKPLLAWFGGLGRKGPNPALEIG
jgi:exopolysaccharide production protein ExoZ